MSRTALTVSVVLLMVPAAAAQLGGLYTINPIAPTGGTNYTSLVDAVNDLMTQGVAAPCIFEIFDDGGPFTGSMPFASNNVTWNPSTAVLVLGQWAGASATNRVTFRAAAGESPVFDASSNSMGVFWNGADYVTLEGIEIINAPMDGVTFYSETQHGQVFGAVVRRCRIHDCGAAGVVIYGNSQRPQNTLVENNFFWNLQSTNAGGFNSLARFGYVSGRRHDNSRLINNTFYVTTSTGSNFCVVGDTPSGGTGSHFAEISNNVIVKTSNPSLPIYDFPMNGTMPAIPALIDANCYWDTSGGPFSAGQINAANFTAWQVASTLDANSFELDPLLVAPAMGDLHLTASSPCVNGSAVPSGVIDDIDGDPRLGIPDIGADEFGAGCASAEYQVNSGLSTATLDGVQATSCMPAVTTRPVNTTVAAVFSSSNVGFGFEIVTAPGALISASAGAFVSPAGQLVNVDIAGAGVVFLFGGALPVFTTPFPGSITGNFTTPSTPQTKSIQMANLDPTHPDGMIFSQGAQLVVQ